MVLILKNRAGWPSGQSDGRLLVTVHCVGEFTVLWDRVTPVHRPCCPINSA